MGCLPSCVLFFVNLLVCGVGIAVVARSSYVIHTIEDYNVLYTKRTLMLPMWTLIGGSALTIVGFLGFCGVLKTFLCIVRLSVGIAVVERSSYVIHTMAMEDYNGLFAKRTLMLPVWTLIGGLALTILGFLGFYRAPKKFSCILRLGVGISVGALSSYVIHTMAMEDYNGLFAERTLMLPVWTLIGGLALTILGFLGFCEVLMKNSCILILYRALVLVFLFVELVCAILFFVVRKEVLEYLHDRMWRTVYMYKDNRMLAYSIDAAQHSLHCCGVKSYNDWFDILGRSDVTKGCCRDDDGVDAYTCYKNLNKVNYTQINEQIYTEGCYDSMIEDLADETLALAILSLILVTVQWTCIRYALPWQIKFQRRRD